MNLHAPQTLTTATELMELAAVPSQIISVRECKPIISVVQDVALGVYRLTKSSVHLTQKQMFNLMASNVKFSGIIPEPWFNTGGVKNWGGRQILSTILPKNVNVRGPNKSYREGTDDNENYVVIENGEIKQGIIDKLVYQNRTKGLVHSIFNECGPQETRIFLDNTQKIVCDWLVESGFSVGISDLIIEDDTDQLKTMIHDMKVEVYGIISSVHKGSFDNKSINNNSIYFEEEVNKILNKTISDAGSVALSKLNDMDNRMINMVKSGSKGSIINVSQMIACLGQQNVDGKRISYGFDERTLPHYTKYDDGPESRGFVENSFITGLSPQEFFFHSMGGREGLIDTAVKSVTGDTAIIIIEDNIPKYVKIGDWIDSHLDGSEKNNVQHSPEDRNLELLNLKSKVYIPTVDDDGKTSWGELTAVTRHDPGERIYKITTLGGRSVTVAESESLLIWNPDTKQFKKMYTPNVKIGDYVPTTAYIPEPPVIVEYVDMSIYFPKTEYVHGTEYNKAVKIMKEAQGDKFRIERGWWEKNNGINFITPYPSKASSNNENIHDGCVYPFHAKRENARIPDKFVLNYENGQFIGIFLADGHCDTPAGSIQISKEDQTVQDFVRSYFDKLNVTHRTVAQQKSYGVIGSSTLLARFLDAFVGVGARNKHVPDVAFAAPIEFVKGILSGYFGGDGTVDRGAVTACSASSRLIEGISMLCSRIGVFGKRSITQQTKTNLDMDVKDIAPMHHISIRAQWGKQFASEVDLLLESKDSHQNFDQYNDMVKDKIVEINVMGVQNHSKLYDVTVPSTLNFVIANGLGCQDTSETGYLQRKLVKAMEDCKIYYDYTVRNASGAIIQFLYGEDGMDASKIESQPLYYLEMDMKDLIKTYKIVDIQSISNYMSDEAISQMTSDDCLDRCHKHFDKIIEDREFLINDVFDKKKESSIMYPVSFMRMINIVKNGLNEQCGYSDLTPVYILDALDNLERELYITKNNRGDKLINILARCYLSPKRVITEYKLGKIAFDTLIQKIKLRFYDAMAHPSEMVGVIAAQSIGEPATQLTLNSVEWNTEVLLKKEGAIGLHRVKIGEFIDSQIESIKDIEYHPNDTSLGWIKDQNYSILSCDENGQVNWKLIEAVTKHPPINEDGSNTLLKVTTKSGREVIATRAKSFLKRVNNKIQPVRGDDLKIGDYLPVSATMSLDKTDIIFKWDISLYVPKTEYIYMSEVQKAIEVFQKYQNNGIRHWFKTNNNNLFTVPYKRSDSFISAYIGIGKNKGNGRRCQLIKSRENCVYPKTMIYQPAHMPEYLDLDENTGFFIGAYLAEGCCTTHHVLISNIDDAFNEKIFTFCKRYDLKYHIDEKFNELGHSKTIRIHSIVLTLLISKACGAKSEAKRIPSTLLAGPDIFCKGLIDGYMSGDGCVDIKLNALSSTSVSIGLCEDIQQLLTRFGISTTITSCESAQQYTISKGFNAQLSYKLQLNAANSFKFKNIFTLTVVSKQNRLDNRHQAININCIDIVPNVITQEHGDISIPRALLSEFKSESKCEEDSAIYQAVIDENILYDKVVSIEEYSSEHKYVYDFTVKDTRNFNIYNGLCIRDTFHLSGVSSASKAVRGVPRIKELLSVTKNVKSPSLTVYLEEDVKKDKKKVKTILNSIETTRFIDIVLNTKIYYDPDDDVTNIDNDIKFTNSYTELVKEGIADNTYENLNPWLLRMELSKEKMIEYELSMIDLYYTIHDFYNGKINIMFSDDNAEKLVFRFKFADIEDDRDVVLDLKALEKNIMENIIIKGIKNINKVSMRKSDFFEYNEINMTYEKTHEWILNTNGSQFIDIMSKQGVDKSRTVSNNINDIYELLGIEASRQALFNELNDVIKDSDLYVNYRHIALLVDIMTTKGYLLSIDRHGINRVDIGPLAKSSFEETTDMIIKAGIFSEVDHINGVSANIMLGQIPPCGTGDSDILIDEAMMDEMYAENDKTTTVEDSIDALCSNLTFDFDLPEKDLKVTKKTVNIKIKNM